MRGWTLAAFLGALFTFRLHNPAHLQWVFLILITAGMALRLWAGAYLGVHGNASETQAPRLQRGGPYRFSRNPLYLANLLVGTALILFANVGMGLALTLILVLVIHHILLVMWEEKNLRTIWRDQYASYVRNTPRWIGWSRSEKSEEGKNPSQWNKVWTWQGRNLAYTVLSALLIWGASLWK